MEGGHPLSYDNCMYTAVRSGQGPAKPQALVREFEKGECDVCWNPDMCQTCCLAIVCPCLVVDAIIVRAREREGNDFSNGDVECCLFEGCTALCPAMSLLQSVLSCFNLAVGASWLCPVGQILTCGTVCVMSSSLANKQVDIKDGGWDRCCCSLFCPCMSLSKMYRHVLPPGEKTAVDCCYLYNLCNH